MRIETIQEKLFFTTVRIETTFADGRNGAGTGFMYSVETGPESVAQMLVTNRHVVEEVEEIALWFIAAEDEGREKPKLGHVHRVGITDPAGLFTSHPDPAIDVAVAPVSPAIGQLREQGHHCFFRSFTPALALSDEDEEIVDAMEEVTFLGYPNGLYDEANGMPIARRGVTATPPMVDHCGKPIFLIDASVFPGSSGSPVLIVDSGTFSIRGESRMGERFVLLGMLAAVFKRDVPVLQVKSDGASYIHDLLDIGVVYKARTIDETVDTVLDARGLTRQAQQSEEAIADPSPEDVTGSNSGAIGS
jgi:hypothetical protein